jgi:hypothetical protein
MYKVFVKIFRFWALSQNCEKRLLASSYVCPPVRQFTWNNSAPTRRIFMKIHIWVFFENLSRKFKFYWNRTRITGTFHDELYTFFIISHSVLLRMINVSKVVEINKTYFIFNNVLFLKSCRLLNNVEYTVQPGKATRDNMARVNCMLDT